MAEHWSENLEVGSRFIDGSGHIYEVLETGLVAARSVNPHEWNQSRTAYKVKCLSRGSDFQLSAHSIALGAKKCN